MQSGESVRRPLEIEEVTNRLVIHPLAERLTALFAKLHVTPNSVSVAGMSFGVLAALAYYHYQDVRYAIVGFVLMVAWHIMDGADGQLARLTHSQSQTGKVLDGICDYVTFIAVYVALTAALSKHFGGWIWLLAVGAGLSHSLQSAAYELRRQEYYFFGLGRESAALIEPNALPRNGSSAPVVQRLADVIYRLYVRVQFSLAGIDQRFHERLVAVLECEPERALRIRERYREAFAPVVRRWSVLSSNYRTIGIFIGALLAVPQYYFAFEILGFSSMLSILIADQHARNARFWRSLGGAC